MVGEWERYLARFHEERAGITERVLTRAYDGGQTPYQWLAGAVGGGPVVDVGCGSAPLFGMVEAGYLGVDVCEAELELARRRAAPVVRGDARDLPVRAGFAGTVVCSMMLHVVEELGDVILEFARVLRPGGRVVALVPSGWSLGLVELGLRFPNEGLLRRASSVFGRAGLTVVSDEVRRFSFRVEGAGDAEMFVRSLYLPGVSSWRLLAARRWARVRGRVPVPVRRIVATLLCRSRPGIAFQTKAFQVL